MNIVKFKINKNQHSVNKIQDGFWFQNQDLEVFGLAYYESVCILEKQNGGCNMAVSNVLDCLIFLDKDLRTFCLTNNESESPFFQILAYIF